jgi:hypothetical protein
MTTNTKVKRIELPENHCSDHISRKSERPQRFRIYILRMKERVVILQGGHWSSIREYSLR